MRHGDVLILLLAVSVSLHAAAGCGWLTRRAGRAPADSVLVAAGAAAGMFSLWVAVIGLYR